MNSSISHGLVYIAHTKNIFVSQIFQISIVLPAYNEEKKLEYSCEKCKNSSYEQGKISTTGSGLSKFLNMQSNNFTTISCTKCGYTEIFKGKKSGALSSIFDVLTN